MRRTTLAAIATATTLTIATSITLARRGDSTPSTTTLPTPTADSTIGLAIATTADTAPRSFTTGTITSTPPATPVTEESPTHAALRFLDLDEELFPPIPPAKARALTESIASPNARARLGQQAFDHQTQILAKGDLAGLKLRLAPILTRTRDCTATACTVDVFFLRLWSFPGQGALDDYATAEIHLTQDNGRWKLEESAVADGPYPAGRFTARPTAGLNAKSFETILAGYTDTEINP